MGETIKKNCDVTTELGDEYCISKKITEHFALHNKCNLKPNPELPRMTSKKFDYLKKIDLNNYYKTGLTKRTIHCEICKLDICNSQLVFLHTISMRHKYNKLFVRIIQNVSENREIDFIVLNINWLQCRYCGTMIVNKHPDDLIVTHIHERAHIQEKEYCMNDFIIRQYGNSPNHRDSLKPVDVLLSDEADSGQMKMKKFEARKERSKKTEFLSESCNNFIIEPSGSTVGNEPLMTEELPTYINRLLMKNINSCRICCEILDELKNMKSNNVNHDSKTKKIKKAKQSLKNTKRQIADQISKNQIVEQKIHSNSVRQENFSKTWTIELSTQLAGVCQELTLPVPQAMNRNIDANEHKDHVLPSTSKKHDINQIKNKIFNSKKAKKTAKVEIKIHRASDYELPRFYNEKEDVTVLNIASKVTPHHEGDEKVDVNSTKRVKNIFNLMRLPDRKNKNCTRPQSSIEYQFTTPKPRRHYKSKVNWKKEAKFNKQEKIRASRDNFFCDVCCKSVPNSKYYIHNHMKGSKHINRILGSNDELWRQRLPRKYVKKPAIKRIPYEDFFRDFSMANFH